MIQSKQALWSLYTLLVSSGLSHIGSGYQAVAPSHGTLQKIIKKSQQHWPHARKQKSRQPPKVTKTQWAHQIHDGQQSSIMRLKPCAQCAKSMIEKQIWNAKHHGHTTFGMRKRMAECGRNIAHTVPRAWFKSILRMTSECITRWAHRIVNGPVQM